MPSLFSSDDRQALLDRLDRITADATPRWGRMTAPQMLAHLSDSMRMALGELKVAPRRLPIRYSPLKELVIYFLPFPKNAPTAPELLSRKPETWELEWHRFSTLLQRCASVPSDQKWPDHPLFGELTPRQWGILGYRHIDHHLRQFGV